MIPEIGQFCLVLALALALVQGVLPLWGAASDRVAWMRVAPCVTLGQALFVALSFACLVYAFVNNDFSVAYVAQNSNRDLPLFYKVAAVWGAHEGSILLWLLMLSFWSVALVVLQGRQIPVKTFARVLSILGLLNLGLLSFVLFTSDPFLRLLPIPPENGRDLNPLLQDPGMILHPPMLYLGYVGFAVVFAFAMTALIEGRLDKTWVSWLRLWVIAAWSILTLGITLGSWWAYRELGWGGWWFWDPVENASLMPWLAATGLIHSLLVVEKRGVFKRWVVFLAITTFALSLLGTFLVRSGILTSVHAFANDPARGGFILLFLMAVIGSALCLYAWKANNLRGRGGFSALSKETLLLGNNILFATATGTVMLGTLYPLVLDLFNLGKISVGPPYFNIVMMPIFLLVMLLMGFGVHCFWQGQSASALFKQLRFTLLFSLGVGLSIPLLMHGELVTHITVACCLIAWVLLSQLHQLVTRAKQITGSLWLGIYKLPARYYGMQLAHLGLAVCAIGITISSAYSLQKDLRLAPGEYTNVGPYHFIFVGENTVQGPNYQARRGIVQISRDGELVGHLNPEKRQYQHQESLMTDADIDGNVWRDLYVALGNPLPHGAWTIRIYFKPFIRWIWAGGILMLLGGLLSLLPSAIPPVDNAKRGV